MWTKQTIVLAVAFCLVSVAGSKAAGFGDIGFPAIIQKGLAEYERSGAIMAFNAWERGGLLEGENGTPRKLQAFKAAGDALGPYRFAEKILTKPIGKSSQIVYASLNFKRGALFMKFWLYRNDEDWVVQNFVFSTRPEALMPWLATEGDAPSSDQ